MDNYEAEITAIRKTVDDRTAVMEAFMQQQSQVIAALTLELAHLRAAIESLPKEMEAMQERVIKKAAQDPEILKPARDVLMKISEDAEINTIGTRILELKKTAKLTAWFLGLLLLIYIFAPGSSILKLWALDLANTLSKAPPVPK